MRLGIRCVLLIVLAVAARAQLLDAMVARVDDGVITWSRVRQEQRLQQFLGEPEMPAETIRDTLVERRLLVAEANKLRLEADLQEARRTVQELARRVGPDQLWETMERLGMGKDDLEEWAARRQLVQEYLDLRRELTFVRESDVRAYYMEHREDLGDRSLSEAREEIRKRLSEKRFQEELRQWVNRQVSEGRVELLPLPET